MQMLKNILGSGNKYYLELKEEVENSEVVQTAVETAEKTAEAVKEKAQEVAKSEPVQSAVKTAGEVVETAQDKVTAAISTEEKPSQTKPAKAQNGKAKQNGKIDKPVEAKQNGKADKPIEAKQNGKAAPSKTATEVGEEAKPTPANSGASSFEPPFWVAAMNNTNKNSANGNAQAAEQTFAPENLLPIATKYRRRPGGSLDKFKDMAKSAKTPKR